MKNFAADTIVVSGLGAVTPLGLSAEETFRRLCAGENAIHTIPRLVEAGFPVTIGAQIDQVDELMDRHPDARRFGSRKLAYFLESLQEARTQSGIADFHGLRAGVFLGVETSRIPIARSFDIWKRASGPDFHVDMKRFGDNCRNLLSRDEILNKFPAFLSIAVAAATGIQGPVMATSNACASANFAIGEAFRRMREGSLDVAIVGSADEMIDEYMITGFSLLRALSFENEHPDAACRPFDCRRSGFVLGEAGAALVLERLDHCLRRGGKPLAVLAGYGSSSDGHKITACHPQGAGLADAMKRALEEGQLPLEDVGYINAHGTSTRLNDQAESRAIKSLFGPHAERIKVNATKSMIGHSVAAAGAVEAVVTVMTLREKIAHPTRNMESSDIGCGLDYCGHGAVAVDLPAALSNSCGFSGGNSCLAFRRYEEN